MVLAAHIENPIVQIGRFSFQPLTLIASRTRVPSGSALQWRGLVIHKNILLPK